MKKRLTLAEYTTEVLQQEARQRLVCLEDESEFILSNLRERFGINPNYNLNANELLSNQIVWGVHALIIQARKGG